MTAARPSIAEQIERIAGQVHDAAFDFTEPAKTINQAEARIARVEDLADALRAAVRGKGR